MSTFTDLVRKAVSNINAVQEEIRANTISTLESTVYPTLEKLESGNFDALQKDFVAKATTFNPVAFTQSYFDSVQRLFASAYK